ncbi:helix-turn-helix transcriptional regulator [Merismopedia glauca]|uniref:HTH luxR-type domain-containing protein n=1 Tax=Merismopedia glauca CCAP 1448/3 TaxID=1296344 RepID=A0A2T1C0N9_9CYAN|nr:LuxR C-terminal-related transcriptional regulator [Merismopedia glauca]PSB01836.1 hypothetical protein C7B64_16185 [Merismopedia glauca CCAP 1448/3]
MNQEEFHASFEQMTKTQRMVLKSFLANQIDEAIAKNLNLDASTVRRHISNLCRIFGLKNESGEHFSYRQELIELFAKFRPDLVSSELLKGVKLEFPDGQVSVFKMFLSDT